MGDSTVLPRWSPWGWIMRREGTPGRRVMGLRLRGRSVWKLDWRLPHVRREKTMCCREGWELVCRRFAVAPVVRTSFKKVCGEGTSQRAF